MQLHVAGRTGSRLTSIKSKASRGWLPNYRRNLL